MNAIDYYKDKNTIAKSILKNINHFGTITISIEGFFIFSLIKSNNDTSEIKIFETIEFNEINRFNDYFSEYKDVTRWFSNLSDNKTLIFNEYFDNIGFNFYTHNLKTSIDELYFNFQGYLNCKEIMMSSEISKIIKTQCNLEQKLNHEGKIEFIPTSHLFNIMYGFKNVQNAVDYFEYDSERMKLESWR